MIVVRPFSEGDTPAIQAMHASMGFDYEQPAWEKMLVSAVVEVDGRPTMAAFLRKTSEVYMLADPEAGTRRDRLGQLLMLHRELLIPAQRVGFEDCHCWVPPEIEQKFGKLLMHLGWRKPLWPCFSKEVK